MAKSSSVLIKWLLTLLVPLIFLLIPVSDTYTSELQMFFMITIFIIIMLAFDLLPTLLPAVLLPTLYLLSGIAPIETIFSPWVGTTIFMILGAFVFTNVLEQCGLLSRISIWCIKRFGGTYNGALYAIFLLGVIVGILTFNTDYVLMPIFSYGVARAFGYDKPSKEAGLILLMGAVGATGAGACTYNPPYIAIMGGVLDNWTLPWYAQTIYNWPVFIAVLLFIFVMTKIWKTKTFSTGSGMEHYEKLLQDMGPLSKAEKKAIVLTIILAVYLFSAPLHGYPIEYGFMIIPWFAFIPGVQLADTKLINGISFPILFFIAGCMGIGSVGNYLGIGNLLSTTLMPILEGHSPVIVLVGVLALGTIANIVMTPYAMAASLTPPLVAVAAELGLNPDSLLMTFLMTTDLYILPHEFVAVVVAYGFGLIKMKDFIFMASLKTAIFFVVFLVIQIPYWYLIGYIYA
ncbi:MAG: SLC13 family permease [Peptococcaceae bacterium]|nr:SLC13 family permease [Peptococcaceae bacterium]